MTKRQIFSELIEGFDDLIAAREGKGMLLTHKIESKAIEPVTSARPDTAPLREKLMILQKDSAQDIQANHTTPKNWEQNLSKQTDKSPS